MFHLRYTPYDISGYTFDFLKKHTKYILAQEDLEDDLTPLLHYHILIETDDGIQTIRNDVKAMLKIPPAGRGKNNKYYALISDWKDPGYICKYNNILSSKGFTEKEILDYVISGKKKYLTKVEKVELSGEVAPATSRPKKEPKVPFQQQVIAEAAADWYNYKRTIDIDVKSLDATKICEFVCNAMRKVGKGINPYLVRELSFAVLYDDLEYKDLILTKVKNIFLA